MYLGSALYSVLYSHLLHLGKSDGTRNTHRIAKQRVLYSVSKKFFELIGHHCIAYKSEVTSFQGIATAVVVL
jgi:hypothetical protein